VQRSVFVLFPAGLFLAVVGTGFLHSVYSAVPYTFGSQNRVSSYVLFFLLHYLVAAITGLPDEPDDVQPALVKCGLSTAVATGSWLLLQAVFPGLLPRRVILTTAVVAPVWTFLCAWFVIRRQRSQTRRDRVWAVLPHEHVHDFNADCERTFPATELSFQLVRSVSLEELDAMVIDRPSTIVLCDEATSRRRLVDAVTQLHRGGVKVRTLSQFYEEYIGKEALSELTRMTMLFDVRTLHHPTYRRAKRALDFAGGVASLFITAVAIPFVVVGNLLANRGPLFYSQNRIGRNGTEFRIRKFRTMRTVVLGEGDFADRSTWTSIDDPRVTPFGRLLRRSHLDELPQSWNILWGDLSLVGPRPEQPHYVNELRLKEPAYDLRHLVTPGLTGWAQIKHRYAATEAEAIEKLQYDLYYLRNQSLALDLRILSRTARSVFRRQGR
jgi:lipopolysaccharide/colanic/teichoic acid biosynthesis glycosyltransferase